MLKPGGLFLSLDFNRPTNRAMRADAMDALVQVREGAPLASVLFAPTTAGIILLPILLYHLAQLVLAAPIAARLSSTD